LSNEVRRSAAQAITSAGKGAFYGWGFGNKQKFACEQERNPLKPAGSGQ